MKRLVLVAVLATLLILSVSGTALAVGPGDGYLDTYKTADFCATLGCHAGIAASWSESAHATPVDYPIGRGGYCRSCHVTNFDPDTEDYSEGGAGCEACHGPGHYSKANDVDMNSSEICGQCHSRHAGNKEFEDQEYAIGFMPDEELTDYVNIPSPGGFAPENFYQDEAPSWHTYGHGGGGQQYQEWQQSRHAEVGIGCTTCHVVHEEGEAGLSLQDDPDVPGVTGHAMLKDEPFELCTTCHAGSNLEVGSVPRNPQLAMLRGESGQGVAKIEHVHASYCTQCHMPATGYTHSGEPGDAGNHLWKIIMPETAAELTTEVEHEGETVEESMPNSACSQCHGTESDPLATRLQSVIDQRQGQVSEDVSDLESRLSRLSDQADLNAENQQLWDEAKYNVDFVKADKSQGFHNYQYAAQLLYAANQKLDQMSTETPSTPEEVSFTDLREGELYFDEVMFLAEREIVGGFGDGTYQPYSTVKRAQFAKAIVLTTDIHTDMIDNVNSPTFTDVPFTGGAYPYDFVEEAAGAEIISGFQDGSFAPYDDITRVQIVRMVVRAGGPALSDPPESYEFPFTDVSEADRAFVAKAHYNGIIGGKTETSFAPFDQANRGQMGKMLFNLYDLMN